MLLYPADGGLKKHIMNIKIIRNSEVDNKTLQKICNIKSISWEYSFEEQKKWIRDNLTENDTHVLLENKGVFVAYLNLVQIKLSNKNGRTFRAIGIGNVCVITQNKGYGSTLIKLINEHFIAENKIGVLFCKKDLVNFYLKNGFKVERVYKNNFFLMSYNNAIPDLIYNGNFF